MKYSKWGSRLLKFILSGLVLSPIALAQQGVKPTTTYQVWTNKTTGFQNTFTIPTSQNIGQLTHALSLIIIDTGASCLVSSNLNIALEGSYDNTYWQQIGSPISTLTRQPGVASEYTGYYEAFGYFPYLRINSRTNPFTNCLVNLSYTGNISPVGLISALPPVGTQIVPWMLEANTTNSVPFFTTTAHGGRFTVYGISIHNSDAATAVAYTLTAYSNPGSTCDASISGNSYVAATYRVPAMSTFTLGFSSIPILTAPSNKCSGGAICNDTYDPTSGFYELCIKASAATLTSYAIAYQIQ